MYTSWTKNLSEKEKKQVISEVNSAQPFIRRLHERLSKELTASDKAQLKNDYDIACWSLKQADHIGEKRALNRVLDILENLKEEV